MGATPTPPRSAWPGVALVAAVLYAAFAGGATALPAEARLEVGLAVTAALGFALLRVSAPPAAWAGVGLLAAFAFWCGLSLEWSRAPDLSWRELNRAIAYVLAALLGLAVGSSLARAKEKVALAFLGVATLVALYALAGKAVPGLGFDHTEDFSRLREPLGYWNALSLFCVLAVPAAVRAATRRPAAAAALVALLVAIALTYSRGGFVALAVALAVMLAIGPERLRAAAVAAAGLGGALPPLLVVLVRDDLRTDGVALSERTGDGLVFLLALVVGAVLATLIARRIAARELAAGPRLRRGARVALAATAAALAVGALGVAVANPGFYGDRADEFTDVRFERQDDPARVLRTSSGNRWVWWKEAVGAWWDEPLAGHGAGSFPLVHLLYRQDRLDVRQAHSVPLELLAETGLVGALLALGGIGLLGLAAGRATLASRDVHERAWAGALAAAAVAWLVHMWFDWDLDIPALAIPPLVFLGVLAARRASPDRWAPRTRRAVAAFGGVALVLVCVSALLPSLARDRTSDALADAGAGRLDRAAERADEAADLDPLAIEPLLAGATVEERRRRYPSAAARLAETVERQPYNPRGWLALARFEFLVGRRPNGIRLADVMRQLDPQSAQRLRSTFTYREAAADSASAARTPAP